MTAAIPGFRAQVSNHAVLSADYCGGKVALSFLQLQDFLLNGVAGNQSIGEDGPSLSNAMRAVYGLRFNRRVPQGSRMNTYSAAVRFKPRPPAFRLTRKSRQSLSF